MRTRREGSRKRKAKKQQQGQEQEQKEEEEEEEESHRADPWNHPGATPGPNIRTILRHIGAILKPYWAMLWALLGPSGGSLVLLLAPYWAPREAVLDHSNTSV